MTLVSLVAIQYRLYRFLTSSPDSAEPDHQRSTVPVLALAAMMSAFSYFTLSSEVHENHLYLVMPFLCIFVMKRGLSWIDLVLVLSWTFNVVIHDGSMVEITRNLVAPYGILRRIWNEVIVTPDGNLNNSVSWTTGLSAAVNTVLFGIYWVRY